MNLAADKISAGESSAPTIHTADEAVAIAHRFLPRLVERANQVEANRKIDDDVIAAINASGLFGLMGAKKYGGSEVGVESLVRVTMEFAEHCGSTGWVFGVLAGHSWMLNLFPAKAQEEISSVPGTLTATLFRLGADVEPVDGGFQITNGMGRFCSGVDFADWIIVGASVKNEAGPPEQRFLIIPRADIEIIDDWHTIGMKGTGSRSVKVTKSFVPEHRSVRIKDMVTGTTPGAQVHDRALYKMPFGSITGYSILGAPLGMARGALNAFATDLQASIDPDAPIPGSQQTRLVHYARAATMVDAAINLVLADARKIDSMQERSEFDAVAEKQLSRNCAWAVQTCRDAVNQLYELSGGSAIYSSSLIQRHWRDINSSSQHVGFTEDKMMLDYAHERFNLPAEAYVIPTKKK